MTQHAHKTALEAAWFGANGPATARNDLEPLDYVRQALQAMEEGRPIPLAAARVFARALRAYLEGQEQDITRALGLRPRRGGAAELPARLERRRARDELIDRAFRSLDGKDTRKAEHLAQLLSEPPRATQITEADLFACIEQLQAQHGGDLPSSGRQILRVVRGDTIAGRRQSR
jgi:hypothetical protein